MSSLRGALAPPLGGSPLVTRALELAQAWHAGQRRSGDGAPFVLHPLEVATLLHAAGLGEQVVAAGLLHDALEDSPATADELRDAVGPTVAALVEAVTEDEAIADYLERKAALRAQAADGPPGVHALFAADKLSKARELRMELARGVLAPDDAKTRCRLEHYRASLALVRARGGPQPLVDQLHLELWSLDHLPPGAPDDVK